MTSDHAALREAAERATPGPWERVVYRPMPHMSERSFVRSTVAVIRNDRGPDHLIQIMADDEYETREADERFVTLWNPQTALTLLDQAEADRARIAELEGALGRQTENMAFVLNRVDLHKWHDRFEQEMTEDRALSHTGGE